MDKNGFFFKFRFSHLSFSDIHVTLKELQIWIEKWFIKSFSLSRIEMCFEGSDVSYTIRIAGIKQLGVKN